ncbi:MAG: nitrite/sulfite reductase [Deltaproteobacteria bacterium]|nr:nitrite/sulfite reductase [Deltaproteobacteria bacterium]
MIARPAPTAIERDKADIGVDFDFEALARRPLPEIPQNVVALFKWTGIYQQLQKGFFMVRVRLPGGRITADRLDGLAAIADEFGQGELCLTTRQTFQLHWVRWADLHRVLARLAAIGLDSKNACGDVTRNVVTCPFQGVCPHEVGDVRDTILALADDPEIRDRQRNLPRKHKISVAGCDRACNQTLMNCHSWVPVLRDGPGGPVRGFRWYAGGGLGARPILAKAIFDWVPEALVIAVARAGVEVYRREGDRRVRALARLKFVVERMGPRGFGDAVLAELRARGVAGHDAIEPAADPVPRVGPAAFEGETAVPQRQAGFRTVRARIPRGEIAAARARRLAELARRHGDGSLQCTARQNLQWRFVPEAQVPALLDALRGEGLALDGLDHPPDVVACVGTTVCNLAVSDTPNAYRALEAAMSADPDLWRAVGPLRIHLNGCPNACAQHWIADIGLRGTRREAAEGSEEGFTVHVGGGLAGPGHVARPVCDVPADRVVEVVQRILRAYLDGRDGADESFGDWARRTGPAGVAALVGLPPAPPEALNVEMLRLRPLLDRIVEEARHDDDAR